MTYEKAITVLSALQDYREDKEPRIRFRQEELTDALAFAIDVLKNLYQEKKPLHPDTAVLISIKEMLKGIPHV